MIELLVIGFALAVYAVLILGTFTHRILMTCSGGTGNGLQGAISGTGTEERNISIALDAGTDVLVPYTLDVSQVQSVFILVDTDALLEVNSSSAPPRALSLKAGEPVAWSANYDSDITNPLGSTDITALYMTNAAACQFELRVTVNS